jgi:putative PD-(D/E)XK family protein DUF4420
LQILTWDVFERYLHSPSPTVLNMGGTRGVQVGFNPATGNMFVRIPTDPGSTVPPSPYSELEIEISGSDLGTALVVSTAAQHLFREFHRFAEIVTEDFEDPIQTAQGALEASIIRWRELISRLTLLSEEKQLGLQGELVFLRALLKIHGAKAIKSWTGRNILLAERHDFRLGQIDIEVKSTRNKQRQHIIHGLDQLRPSMGHTLYLLSLRFESAGLSGGRSLCDEVEDIRRIIGMDSVERSEFEHRILASGYRDNDEQHYQEKLIFADAPILVNVDDNFPKIVRDTLESTLPSESAGRITDVSYRINIDGLGVRQGSEPFIKVIGELRLEI